MEGASCASERSPSGGPSIPAKRSTTESLLVDTNILLEATDEKREFHAICVDLLESRPGLRAASQVIREYIAVATRPVAANGLGLSVSDALENVRAFRSSLRLLPEEKPVLPTFLSLLEEVPCQGKHVHDANLIATALVHRVRAIVTLNPRDFAPFAARIKTIEPADVGRTTQIGHQK
ncbi:MAG: type II toxin-antitoxin system VapC family toxin [Candidatus Binatia bacterium]